MCSRRVRSWIQDCLKQASDPASPTIQQSICTCFSFCSYIYVFWYVHIWMYVLYSSISLSPSILVSLFYPYSGSPPHGLFLYLCICDMCTLVFSSFLERLSNRISGDGASQKWGLAMNCFRKSRNLVCLHYICIYSLGTTTKLNSSFSDSILFLSHFLCC